MCGGSNCALVSRGGNGGNIWKIWERRSRNSGRSDLEIYLSVKKFFKRCGNKQIKFSKGLKIRNLSKSTWKCDKA